MTIKPHKWLWVLLSPACRFTIFYLTSHLVFLLRYSDQCIFKSVKLIYHKKHPENLRYEFAINLFNRLTVTEILYSVVSKYTTYIEAVSCDELYIDATEFISANAMSPEKLAEKIRCDFSNQSNLRVSIGIGRNRLLARMATNVAKPDGVHHVIGDGLEFMLKARVRTNQFVSIREFLLSKMNLNKPSDTKFIPGNKQNSLPWSVIFFSSQPISGPHVCVHGTNHSSENCFDSGVSFWERYGCDSLITFQIHSQITD